MKKNIIKILNIIAIFLVIISLVFSLVLAQDTHHLFECHDDGCIHCAIIHISQSLIKGLNLAAIILITFASIYYFLARLYKTNDNLNELSLVAQKVRLNE